MESLSHDCQNDPTTIKDSDDYTQRVSSLTQLLRRPPCGEDVTQWAISPGLSFWFGDEPENMDTPSLKSCILRQGEAGKYISRAHRWVRFCRRFACQQFEQWVDVPFSRGRVVIVSSKACPEIIEAAFPTLNP